MRGGGKKRVSLPSSLITITQRDSSERWWIPFFNVPRLVFNWKMCICANRLHFTNVIPRCRWTRWKIHQSSNKGEKEAFFYYLFSMEIFNASAIEIPILSSRWCILNICMIMHQKKKGGSVCTSITTWFSKWIFSFDLYRAGLEKNFHLRWYMILLDGISGCRKK